MERTCSWLRPLSVQVTKMFIWIAWVWRRGLECLGHCLGGDGDEAENCGKRRGCGSALLSLRFGARHHTASTRLTERFGLERMTEETPTSNEDFRDWFLRWLDLFSHTEITRPKAADDIKCGVVWKRAPKELKGHLVMQTVTVENKFPLMREIVDTESHWRRNFDVPGPSHRPVIF